MTSTLRKRIKTDLVVAGVLVLAYLGRYVCYRTASLQSPEEHTRQYGQTIEPFARALVVKSRRALHFFGPLMEVGELVVLFTLFLLFGGCGSGSAGEISRLVSGEEQKLLFIKEVPLGLTYEEVKRRLPVLGPFLPEGGSELLGKDGLFEADAKVVAFEREGQIEFNFKDNRLYSYYFSVPNLDHKVSTLLLEGIETFYSRYYGKPSENEEEEPGYAYKGFFWNPGRYDVGAGINSDGGSSYGIAWGFQVHAAAGTPVKFDNAESTIGF